MSDASSGQGGDAGGEGFAGDAGGFDGGGGFDGYDGGDFYDGGGYDGQGFAPAADPGQTAAALQGVIGNSVQQHLGPLQAQMSEWQQERGAAELVSQHPELGQQENAERLIGTARQVAQQIGAPHLADNPRFWGLVHSAMGQADAAAQAERENANPAENMFGAPATGKLPF